MTRNTILIVDDERPVRRVVRLVLTKAGYDVIEADDGAMAIEMMHHGGQGHRLLAVICDVEMPRMNGVEAIEQVRREFPATPLLVLTGTPDMSVAFDLLKQGIAGYLLKPFEPQTLVAAVERATGNRRPNGWAGAPRRAASFPFPYIFPRLWPSD
ncbi:response regulator [Nitrospira moscoviensis]|uniref:Putative Response regulator, CheY-like (Modular protein) n=1 Tax=Nitrospira moscoviensis TaxID=42253 RepID=A0A0K2GIG2_NITMO|nr:response regulator [Nitrospira moscoviensis]ALA60726.1 Putative Response regulator, CheY-like (modular protein) [Nitrospira moscoviensis]